MKRPLKNLAYSMLAAGLVLLAKPAFSTTVGSGGVDNLVVGSEIYDVEFIAATCSNVFSPCTSVGDFPFPQGQESDAALAALVQAINESLFRNTPNDFIGCELTEQAGCAISTPYGFQADGNLIGFSSIVLGTGPVVGLDSYFFTTDAAVAESFITFATWTQVSTVPVTSTVLLIMAGLGGLACIRSKTC